MRYKSPEVIMKKITEKVTDNIKNYLIENSSYLKETDFSLDPDNLGIEIDYFSLERCYLIKFNNLNRLSYATNTLNSLPIGVGEKSIAQLVDVRMNGIYIEQGFILGKKSYTFFVDHTEKFFDSYIYAINNPVVDKQFKLEILEKFENMLETNPKELEIDKFIENHPFIIELSLHLTDLKHQIKLKDIEEDFNQDLKPDLIAYKPLDKRWYIVDYKRSKRNLIKKPGKVRSGFLAEVNDLVYQLNDYINYFTRSRVQTKFIKEKYGMDIKYPKGIGIIGNLKGEKQETLLKARENLPREIDNIYPYNHIIEECRRVLTIRWSREILYLSYN